MTTLAIRVAFDPGSSLTKFIYSVGSDSPKLLTMAPETLKLSEKSVARDISERSSVGVVNGINDAYLKYRKRDDNVYVVGHLTHNLRAEVDLAQSKYESAVPKFLAAIGAILDKEGRDESEVEVIPIVLLPYNEFASRESFIQKLEERGKRYYFRDRKITLSFRSISVVPEGGGYLTALKAKHGEGWLEKREAVCVLMIGHRNASFLTFRHGRLDTTQSQTSDWGFVRLVDRAIEHSSGQDRERLTREIYEIGNDISPDNIIVQSLTRTRERDNSKDEAVRLAEAIELARKEYWQLLRDWLNKVIPRRVNSLTIAGGGASYLHSELSEFLAWANLEWNTLSEDEPLLRDYPDASLRHRIGDVYSAYVNGFKVDREEAA